jgi:hypothetical protein
MKKGSTYLCLALLTFFTSLRGALITQGCRGAQDDTVTLGTMGWCHRGHRLDQECDQAIVARQEGAHLSMGVRKRVQWLRIGVQECNMPQWK